MTLSEDELFEMAKAISHKVWLVYESFWKAQKASDFSEANRLCRLHTELTREHSEIVELMRNRTK